MSVLKGYITGLKVTGRTFLRTMFPDGLKKNTALPEPIITSSGAATNTIESRC